MTPTHAEIDTLDSLDQERLEQAWFEDKEEHSRLEAELQRLEQRKRELQSLLPVYDSRLRHDSRFPDSVGEDAGSSTHNDRLSLAGDERLFVRKKYPMQTTVPLRATTHFPGDDRLFLAGHRAPVGSCRLVGTMQEVRLDQEDDLPATGNGRVAVYERLIPTWAERQSEQKSDTI